MHRAGLSLAGDTRHTGPLGRSGAGSHHAGLDPGWSLRIRSRHGNSPAHRTSFADHFTGGTQAPGGCATGLSPAKRTLPGKTTIRSGFVSPDPVGRKRKDLL